MPDRPAPEASVPELLDFDGKTVVVTGSAQGFGAAIARRFAEQRGRVVVADLNGERAGAYAAELAAAGHTALAEAVDVADADAVEQMVERLCARFGHVDVVVNNAGVFSNYLAHQMPPAEFERVLRVNVLGTFHVTRAVVRRWLEAGRKGVVVNVASVDAFCSSAEGLTHYTTSKHAIAGLTRSLAMELAPHGIRVNAVCPGAAMTEGAISYVTEGAPAGIDVVAQWDGIRDLTPMRRLCEPDDVALGALYLASEMAAFVTGVLLPIDGGMLVRPLEGYVHST